MLLLIEWNFALNSKIVEFLSQKQNLSTNQKISKISDEV